MGKITFEDYCNQPAFATSQSQYNTIRGITRKEYFIAEAMKSLANALVVKNSDVRWDDVVKAANGLASTQLISLWENL